jgi:hypothetical protein
LEAPFEPEDITNRYKLQIKIVDNSYGVITEVVKIGNLWASGNKGAHLAGRNLFGLKCALL